MSYHMRRSDREIKDKNEILDVIKTGKYAVIALCNDDEPYVVTMSYGFDESTETFYFHGAAKGHKIDFIKANPNACLTIIKDLGYQYEHCTHAYKSIVVRGKMALIENARERIHGIKIMIHQLETNTEKQLMKIDDSNGVWRGTQLFQLGIESITCKESPKIE